MTPKEAVIQALEEYGPIPGANENEKLAYLYLDSKHLDSFAILSLVLKLEERFSIRFSASELQSLDFRRVGGLVGILEELIHRASSERA